MSSNSFRFKQFEILQNDSVMKVGTDGVLLGAAVECGNAEKILDIGTGTGLITLMLAQKSDAIITAIDINPDAVDLAILNVKNSPFYARIKVLQCSVQDFGCDEKFDLIVSNPPYFTTTILAPDKNRAMARHNIGLTITELVQNLDRLLSSNGRAFVIFPVEQANLFEKESIEQGYFVKSKLIVSPRESMAPVRIITEISRAISETKISNIAIEKEARHDYTDEYKKLTSAWYLKF